MEENIVTVVTPTLNAIEYLRECIESVRQNASSGIRVEHIIADGGSSDGTPEMADASGLRVLRRPGKDLTARLNEASFDSSGDLIGYIGADDVMPDGAVEAVVRAWRRSGKRWIVGGVRWMDENGQSLGEMGAPPTWITTGMYASLGWSPIMQNGTYLSRDFFKQLGGYDAAYQASPDYEMFARALSSAPYERVACTVANLRRTGRNYSFRNRGRAAQENDAILSRFGPESELQRWILCYALKLRMNLANPEWLLRKLAGRARAQLGFQKVSYF